MYEIYSEIYKAIAEKFLIEKYSIKSLDDRFGECKAGFISKSVPDKELRFLSLYNHAYVERLSKEDISLIGKLNAESSEEDMKAIAEVVARTYHNVLANGIQEQFYMQMNGGKRYDFDTTIIFNFNDEKEFDENGNYIQPNETEKVNTFYRVKEQFEKLVRDKTGDEICLVRI